MLGALSIHDMLLIDRLELEFQPGLNVLTGETGAGKSILLDCLGFVLGWRGRADLVRDGADKGVVEAVFHLTTEHPARALLNEAGMEVEGDLILRRVNHPDGRKQAWVNDRRASGDLLRRLSETLVELHGQHDDKGLLDPREHRALLDRFADAEEALAATRAAWRAVSAADKALATRRARVAELAQDREYMEHALAELQEWTPEPDEEAQLEDQRRLMKSGKGLRDTLSDAEQALGFDGAAGSLRTAARAVQRGLDDAGGALDAVMAQIIQAEEELDRALSGVQDAINVFDFDPRALERLEDRLFALRGLARKHGVPVSDLPGVMETLAANVSEIAAADRDLGDLEAELSAAREAYESAAAVLSVARRSAAKSLDQAMAGELAPLKMERAVFTTEIAEAPEGPEGRDLVQFVVATNPGAPSGPLNRIASGGEMSRFLLALKVCLQRGVEGKSMIFDEIDRGVGGATADAVGRRLATLADGGQVLVVTHSPQVAALGQHHWRVLKSSGHDETRSDVVPVKGEDRVAEVARMLAGDEITNEARKAAEVLLSRGQGGGQ